MQKNHRKVFFSYDSYFPLVNWRWVCSVGRNCGDILKDFFFCLILCFITLYLKLYWCIVYGLELTQEYHILIFIVQLVSKINALSCLKQNLPIYLVSGWEALPVLLHKIDVLWRVVEGPLIWQEPIQRSPRFVIRKAGCYCCCCGTRP